MDKVSGKLDNSVNRLNDKFERVKKEKAHLTVRRKKTYENTIRNISLLQYKPNS